jgi:hypothetical protein
MLGNPPFVVVEHREEKQNRTSADFCRQLIDPRVDSAVLPAYGSQPEILGNPVTETKKIRLCLLV